MKVLVTGVKGQLGYDMIRRLNERKIECKGVDLEDFAETCGYAPSRAEIEARFGAPAEIAADFQNQIGSPAVRHGFFRGWMLIFLAAALLVVLALFAVLRNVQTAAPIPDIDIRQTQSFSGQKNVTFYTPDHKALLTLSLSGAFFGGGQSAKPDDAALVVTLHNPEIQVDAQCAYTSGDAVYGVTSVTYNGETTRQTVRMTCDQNGKIH